MLQSLDHTCYVYNNTTKTQIALLIKNIDGGVGYRWGINCWRLHFSYSDWYICLLQCIKCMNKHAMPLILQLRHTVEMKVVKRAMWSVGIKTGKQS